MEQEPNASGGGEAPPATQPTSAISDPLLSPAASATSPSDDLCYEVDSLHDLAARGQWRSVLDKVVRARALSLLSRPHDHLVYLTFSALALLKLRRPAEALAELDSLQPLPISPTSPDPFASPRFLFESYSHLYPGRQGSILPFSLRLLHASLPQSLGDRTETLDRLYSLLDFVRSKIRGHHRPSEEKDSFAADRWRRRETLVMCSLICNHFCHREFDVALVLIRDLLVRSPSDPVLLSRLAYVQLQIGDFDGAKATFAKVEGLRSEEMGVEFENLVGRNRALEFLAAKDFASAAREYDECIERDPGDVVSVNNKALCLMYSRDLSDAIKLLEGALERVPTAALNETVVVNLCSMYELAYVNHGEIKKSLSNWIARVAPDDFDPSCTRI